MIFYLAYTSRRTIPTLSEPQRQAMVDRARVRNDYYNLTGILIVHEGYFTQLIEGAKEDVMQLWHNIKGDSRHSGIELLFEGEEQERMFKGWPLKYENVNISTLKSHKDIYSKLIEDSQTTTKPLTAHVGPRLLNKYLVKIRK